jgi:hypothetical protein
LPSLIHALQRFGIPRTSVTEPRLWEVIVMLPYTFSTY